MRKVRALAMTAGLVFLLGLALSGCAGHGSDTMGDSSMGTTMESSGGEHMDKGMDNTMQTDTMDKGMEKDMQDSMMK
jgi:hypothetical protein